MVLCATVCGGTHAGRPIALMMLPWGSAACFSPSHGTHTHHPDTSVRRDSGACSHTRRYGIFPGTIGRACSPGEPLSEHTPRARRPRRRPTAHPTHPIRPPGPRPGSHIHSRTLPCLCGPLVHTDTRHAITWDIRNLSSAFVVVVGSRSAACSQRALWARSLVLGLCQSFR